MLCALCLTSSWVKSGTCLLGNVPTDESTMMTLLSASTLWQDFAPMVCLKIREAIWVGNCRHVQLLEASDRLATLFDMSTGPCAYELHEDHIGWEGIKAEYDKQDPREHER